MNNQSLVATSTLVRMKAILLLLLCTLPGILGDHCDVLNSDKYDCAPGQAECAALGCCWVPAEKMEA